MRRLTPLLGTGLGLSVLTAGLAMLSVGFPYGAAIADVPLVPYIGAALVLGGLWACLPAKIRSGTGRPSALWGIILVGIAMRGAMLFSAPVLEDDSYRYLWDGAVTSRGIDPYQYAPAAASPDPVLGSPTLAEDDPDLRTLQQLAQQHAEPHSRINYPYVATIYPPLSQAAFALAHWIEPFGLTGWRLVLVAADLVTLVLLLNLLRAYGRAPEWVSLYWWNPVVLLHGFGAGHMDVLVVPFLVGAVLLARRKRPILATQALAAGAAIKIWPVLLFPLLVRPLLKQRPKLVMITILFGASLTLLLLPQLLHVLRPEAGLNAYASEWRTHAFVFSILEDVVFAGTDTPGQLARGVVALFMVAGTGYVALRFANQADRLPVLVAGVIAALIFLSPTGYPWYLIWLAPFLPFVPHPGLISLFVLAPLYWLRFPLGDTSALYQWGVVPIAFGIPLGLIAWTLLKKETPRCAASSLSLP